MTPKLRTVLLYVLVGLSAFLMYLGSFNNGFIWDDPIVLEQQMVAFKSIHDVFIPPDNIPQFGTYYYRPLCVLSYMVDGYFTGPRPMELPKGAINPYHVSVVVYHTIVSLLVFCFGSMLLKRKWWGQWAAFGGALIFAVHPIHTESVCWMAGRSDVLASLGVLPALIFFIAGKRRRQPLFFVAGAAMFLVGLWAKETGIAAIIALPLLDLLPDDDAPPAATNVTKVKGRAVPVRQMPGFALRYVPYIVAAVIYWYMRYLDLGMKQHPKSASGQLVSVDLKALRAGFGDQLMDLIGAIGFYLRKTFVPTRLTAFIADVPHDGLTMAIGVLGLIGWVALIVWAWKKREIVGLVLAALFFATLAPSFAIAFFDISESPVAERYLYIPSVAACLGIAYAAGLLIEWLGAKSGAATAKGALWAAVACGAAVFTVYAYATTIRNETWSDDLSFWEDTVAKDPTQGLPHLHLGLVYDRMEPEDKEEARRAMAMAEKEFLLALDEKNVHYDVEGRSIAWNNLANVYMSRGDYPKAIECFQKSIDMRTNYHTPYYGMCLTHYNQALAANRAGDGQRAANEMVTAEGWCQQAIRLNPRYTKAYMLLGTVEGNLGKGRDAAENLRKVIALEPGSSIAAQAQKTLNATQKNGQ